MEHNVLCYFRCWNICLDVKYEENYYISKCVILQYYSSFTFTSNNFLKTYFRFRNKAYIIVCMCDYC